MAIYEIENTISGASLGLFSAESPEAALEAMSRDAGYDSFAAACAVTGSDGSDLSVSPRATPESLCVGTPAPEWAAGAIAFRVDRSYSWGDDVWNLVRDGQDIGCMYDDGAGYRFAEGVDGADLADDDGGEPSNMDGNASACARWDVAL